MKELPAEHKQLLDQSILYENLYKVQNRWYLTPCSRNKMFHEVDCLCWRCRQFPGDFLHIWWTYPMIQRFWRTVSNMIFEIMQIVLEFSPKSFLLNIVKNRKDEILIGNLLTAVKLLIQNTGSWMVYHWKISGWLNVTM